MFHATGFSRVADLPDTLEPGNCRLVAESGGATGGLAEQLAAAGTAVLLEHAGAGYRRPLMKQLATLALARLAARVPAGAGVEE